MKIDLKVCLKLILVIGVFLISFYSVRVLVKGQQSREYISHPAIGNVVPAAKLEKLGGELVDLRELIKGEKAILFFWSSTCPHCVKELQEQDKIQGWLREEGIRYVSIDPIEKADRIQRFLKKMSLDVMCYIDQGGELSSALKVVGVPVYYFIQENGNVVRVEHDLTEEMIRDFVSKGSLR